MDDILPNRPEEFDEDHESVAWAIKDTGFNIEIIAADISRTLSRDQVAQLINRLQSKIDNG